MNTLLSPMQESSLERYRAFARQKVAPQARALEAHTLPVKEVLESLGQAGYLGMTVPQEHGGQGAPFLEVALLVEALSEFEPGLALAIAGHTTVIELIRRYASEAEKSRYLPLLARGETIGSFAVSEETAGTDFQAARTEAARAGDKLVLTGKKVWVVNAGMRGLAVVLVRQAGQQANRGAGEHGADPELALVIVDLSEASRVKISGDRPRLGLRSACVNDVEFEGQAVPAENLLQSPDGAVEQVLRGMDVAKVIMAAAAVGLARGALDEAVAHARAREQFGKSIGQFQAVQWKLADHAVEGQGARLHTYRAAWAADAEPESFRRYAAMCKWYAARAARVHSGEALQVLGAFGLSEESPLARFYRDAKAMEICEGTTEFQKILLVDELGI